MRKRVLALALVLLALVSVLPPGLAAEAEATFVVEAPETLPAVGEEFTVTVRLENNPGCNVVQFTLPYDSQIVSCTKATLGEGLVGQFAGVNARDDRNHAIVACATPETIVGDQVAATFVFEVKQSVDELSFDLENVKFGNAAGEHFPFQTTGTVMTAEENSDGPSVKPQPSQTPDDSEPSPKPEPDPEPEPAPKPEPKPEPEPVVFTDLEGHWGESFAQKAAQAGLFKGYPDGSFRPDEAVSRAQFVTVLWRLAGTPGEERETPFTDIADQYIDFRKAIAWGYHQGYVRGTAEDAFSPDSTLTRQEAMTILFRYAGGQSGTELMFTSIYDSQFQDSGDIAPWAKSAMYWGVYRELIQGTGGGNLSPTGSASRVQIAKIMTQYQDKFGKEEQ